jgi:phosphate/sulfate permease
VADRARELRFSSIKHAQFVTVKGIIRLFIHHNSTRGAEIMNDQLPPVTPVMEEPKKNNTTLIIAIVAVVLLCCCCAIVLGGWFYGDQILQAIQGG